jgi:hypothetical protein
MHFSPFLNIFYVSCVSYSLPLPFDHELPAQWGTPPPQLPTLSTPESPPHSLHLTAALIPEVSRQLAAMGDQVTGVKGCW